MEDKIRARNWEIILYPDNEKHLEAIKLLRLEDYADILHNRDFKEDTNELKKPHYHFILRYKNPRYLSSLAQEYGIEENLFRPVKSLKGALIYLTHINEPDKALYSTDEVEGTLKPLMLEYLNSSKTIKTDGEKAGDLYNFIFNYTGTITISALTSYALENGQWDALRRGFSIFREVIKEVNSKEVKTPGYLTKEDFFKENEEKIIKEVNFKTSLIEEQYNNKIIGLQEQNKKLMNILKTYSEKENNIITEDELEEVPF